MRVLVIADPHISVPPSHYGGAERTVAILCAGLVRRGHTVDLLAGPGSRAYGEGRLIVHYAPGQAKRSRAHRKILFQWKSLRAALNADVIVNFGRCDYLWAVTRLATPLTVAFQNPALQSEIDSVLARRRRHVRFVGVSESQMTGLEPRDLIDVVHNVAEASALTYRAIPDDPPYVAYLGRVTENKGVHLAIAAARAAGVRLVIAGNVSATEAGAKEYFESRIEPELGPGVEYIGAVNDAEKSRLLGGATALLFPVQWDEPCALVLPESFACGCPVIGWNRGCVPEILGDGTCGFVVDSVNAMARAIGEISRVDRAACRRAAETRFSADVLVDGYLGAIQKAMAG